VEEEMYKLLLGIALGIILPVTSQAAPMCSPREDVLEMLEGKYKESPIALGITNDGGLLEVFSTDGGETWTIIVTSPRGESCLVAVGEDWHTIENLVEDPEV
jgi:hypothetical protein